MYKLLAIDLDGTLLDDNSKIPHENLAAIKKALDIGVKVVLSSGRSPSAIRQFENELELISTGNFSIAFNGGVIYDTSTQTVFRELMLEKTLANSFISEINKYDTTILIYLNSQVTINREIEGMDSYGQAHKLDIVIEKNLTSIDRDISSLMIHGENRLLLKIENHLSNMFNDKAHICFSHPEYLEIGNIKANKGVALKELATHLKIDMDDVIAVGNNHNDVSMIKEAAIGVAVANADHKLKDVSNYITKTTNNEGAIKEVIDKFILDIG
jgi:Cof subfamily protein (haloacid dehalogenase superfamily)